MNIMMEVKEKFSESRLRVITFDADCNENLLVPLKLRKEKMPSLVIYDGLRNEIYNYYGKFEVGDIIEFLHNANRGLAKVTGFNINIDYKQTNC